MGHGKPDNGKPKERLPDVLPTGQERAALVQSLPPQLRGLAAPGRTWRELAKDIGREAAKEAGDTRPDTEIEDAQDQMRHWSQRQRLQ